MHIRQLRFASITWSRSMIYLYLYIYTRVAINIHELRDDIPFNVWTREVSTMKYSNLYHFMLQWRHLDIGPSWFAVITIAFVRGICSKHNCKMLIYARAHYFSTEIAVRLWPFKQQECHGIYIYIYSSTHAHWWVTGWIAIGDSGFPRVLWHAYKIGGIRLTGPLSTILILMSQIPNSHLGRMWFSSKFLRDLTQLYYTSAEFRPASDPSLQPTFSPSNTPEIGVFTSGWSPRKELRLAALRDVTVMHVQHIMQSNI